MKQVDRLCFYKRDFEDKQDCENYFNSIFITEGYTVEENEKFYEFKTKNMDLRSKSE